MGIKYYAVKNGLKPGIYKTWSDCEAQIKGFSGASYKSFTDVKQAQIFLGELNTAFLKDEEINESESEARAYVDGSYNDATKEFSYGVVILHDEIEDHFSEKFQTCSISSMRNVAGEIKAAERAMQFCIDNGIKSVNIYHDYEGIAKWCTGEWRAKTAGTKAYRDFYMQLKNKLIVNFIKVRAHSGNEFNELADSLAKSALGLVTTPDIAQRNNNMTACNIKLEDFFSVLELLKEDIKNLEVQPYDHSYGKGFTLSIDVPKKEKLKVVHFSDKNKIWLQGKKESIFNQLSLYIVELLETEEVPKFLNTVYELEVDNDVVESEFNKILPNAVTKLPKKVSRTLHQAVYNLNLNGAMYDATFIAEPAIRAMEAVLKIALKNSNIPLRKPGDRADSFFVFTKTRGADIYTLKKEYVQSEHSTKLLKYLSTAYTHFNAHRHTLSHWDDPEGVSDTTRLLDTPTEAHTLIRDTLKIINDFYEL